MASSRKSAYAPFEADRPAAAAEGKGAADVVGLAVIAALLFVAAALVRAFLGSFEPPREPPAAPAPQPPPAVDLSVAAALLRPKGELSEQAETVNTGWMSDTVVFTGRVKNTGAGGKLVVRVRAEFGNPDLPPVTGEQVFTTVNASSSEPYRIELEIDSVKKGNPAFVHEVFVP